MYESHSCFIIILFRHNNSIYHSPYKKKYKYKFIPGFFAFLHTFGRPLNFNPHIHVIIAEGLIDKNHNFKKYNYFNYDALSKRFMKILLDKMELYFGKDNFKDIKNKMYLKYKNGFYVNNKLEDDGYKFNSIEDLIKYVTRYCSRSVIAESRIINYDGNNVTWYYSDHTHEQYHEITESAFSFISKLLRHLLPSNFKSIRYYGFYNKSTSLCDKLILLVNKEKRKFMRSLLKWHNSILTSFNRFPTRCPICGFERLVPQSEFKKMNDETFKNNKLFICDKCNIRMNPITVEVDY